jgi:hypothetical protein
MGSPTEVRDHLVRALEADLVGPFDPDAPAEVLPLAPSKWYLTGFLAPVAARDPQDPDADDETAAGDDQEDDEAPGGAEPGAKQKNLFPASMGLSVLLPEAGPAGADVVRATVSFAEYVPETREQPGKKRPRLVWRRVPRGPFTLTLPLDAEAIAAGVAVPDTVGIRVRGKLERTTIREADGGTRPVRALSLFVVNERAPSEEKGRADEQLVFQVQLVLEHDAGLVPRPNRQGERESGDWDDRVADLQFRERCEWAVGHNVSVAAEASSQAARVTRVSTTWLPRHEVRRVVTRELSEVTTSMDALGALATGEAARPLLSPLVDAYRAWLDAQRAIPVDSKSRAATRDALVTRAAQACERIRAGIELLARDPELLEAFALANRAMAMAARQRSPERYEAGADGLAKAPPSWRLFQLAFVLMSLPGLADPRHADREIVDLVFFPTGGGKTEAYLGVIAVTLALRRIRARSRPDAGLGVAVLLRYTLRLLTLDQLGRAATLICALEQLRKERAALPGESLGDVRFSIGLWVGRSATANTMAQVKEKIVEYKVSASSSAPSPCPLTHCPWCQTALDRNSLDLQPSKQAPEEVVVGCVSMTCAFSARNDRAGIPVVFVDEQIYRELPCFLVATVDKFAMLPWRGETGMLFGRATAREGRRFWGPMDERPPRSALALPDGLRPPELIVQDELHLISGPLGTMVGLYETAIEHLCTGRTSDGAEVRPKVIASTATVRRAREQIGALFGRERMALFPPPGVNDSDTFFARVDPESPGRLYVGVAAPGRSMKAILLRAYIDLLCAGQKRFDPKAGPRQPADAYMTLVGYFNSLRELGGMRRLVEDEVHTRSRTIDARTPEERATPSPWFAPRDVKGEPAELTSRESTSKIAGYKARLALPHLDPDRVDVLLASNMISVGVDIDRLGLMVVAGQPKTTSEYIQASSRVGRQHPGLVVTCFNTRKPRDRSHYERFAAYHASVYRFVEAQSLTPFSGPALERGLAGTLVAMTRLASPAATPPAAVKALPTIQASGGGAVKALAARVSRMAGSKSGGEEAAKNVAARGKNLLDAWERLVSDLTSGKEGAAAGHLHYSPYDRDKASVHMLHTVLDDPRPDLGTDYPKFRAPTSMRDVEASVHLWIERGAALGGKK